MAVVNETGVRPSESLSQTNGHADNLESRVENVALENLPTASLAAGEVGTPTSMFGESLPPQQVDVEVTVRGVFRVDYVEDTGGEVSDARQNLSTEFYTRLTQRDPGYETREPTGMQQFKMRLMVEATRERVQATRESRYELINQILYEAKSEDQALDFLTNEGFSFIQGIGALAEKKGPRPTAARQLLKAVLNTSKPLEKQSQVREAMNRVVRARREALHARYRARYRN